MYGFIWRHLPGNTAAKIAQCLVLLGVVFWLLMYVIFPAIEPHLPMEEVVVG